VDQLKAMVCGGLLTVFVAISLNGAVLAAEHSPLALPNAQPSEWLSAGRDVFETRFSPLESINDSNVARLGLAWSYDLDTHRGQEATPVMVDGVLYTSTAWSHVLAFNAATGALLWQFDPKVPGNTALHACCDVVNRGVAVWRQRVYVATLDGRLIALDAATGKPIWSRRTVDPSRPYTITGAPLVAAGKVIIGNGGAEYGVRGYVSAYDAVSGKLAWRFYTVPGDPAKGFETAELKRAAKTWSGKWWIDGGGGTVWNAFSYDPDRDLLYFGTGNASPWGQKGTAAQDGAGDDYLYATSIIAVQARTGRYVWHFQVVPGDHWDYDADQNLVLATLPIHGQPRDVIMQASKNGFFYVLDCSSGEFLSANNFVPVNWTTGLDAKTGRPGITPEAKYFDTGKVWLSAPGAVGAHSWQPMAFSPQTRLVYIPAQEAANPYLSDPDYQPRPVGMNNAMANMATAEPADPKGHDAVMAGMKGYLSAWDPVAQHEAWRVEYLGPWNGGLLATAGNLVFQGTAAGDLHAYRASDGRRLWSFAAQSGVIAAPMTYAINGRQYVSVLVGWGGVFPLVSGDMSFKSGRQVNRSRLLTFALDATGSLPPVAAKPVRVPTAPMVAIDPLQAERGAKAYAGACGSCHGAAAVAGGVVPDLRYSAALNDDALWHAVVFDGVLTSQGMVGFKSYLRAAELEDIKAFLRLQSQRAVVQP
jgi:quinohemoprotein ethanol dehydrogenase